MNEVKPRPCVGCGYCCKKAMCAMGVMILGRVENHCPFLLWSDKQNRYLCRMAIANETFKEAIHAGEGCCCSLNDWRNEVKRRD